MPSLRDVAFMNSWPEWKQFEAINRALDELLALPPNDRTPIIAHWREQHPEQAALLERLLAAAETESSRFDNALGRAIATSVASKAPSSNEMLGDWQLGRWLGRGGMAEVWFADGTGAHRGQRAAIKRLAPGLATPVLIARFEQERAILATLDDPGIARLIDGGVDARGLPWLAMEFVDGQSLLDWCDARDASIEERLERFIEIARTVSHAHQRLIVHRDLKPSNVMIDGEGRVRLLDFGIAKLLGPQSFSDAATLTSTGAGPLTPQYAAPEQLRGEAITTAVDIYALGVMLYELLTGRKPYRVTEPSAAAYERAVLERDPTRPSAIVIREEDADPGLLKTLAEHRRLSPTRLGYRLRGDLDAIVLKAMRKEPAQRYESAAAMADDVRYHLSNLPVRAARGSTYYHFRRWLRRRALVAALILVATLSLLGGLGAALWQKQQALTLRDQAIAEAEKTRRLSEFMVGVFANANPEQTQGETVTAKALLDQAASRIDAELPVRDEVRADLLAAISSAYYGLGIRGARLPYALEALSIERELNRPEHLVRRLIGASAALRDAGRAAEGLELAREAENRLLASGEFKRSLLGATLHAQAMAHFSLGEDAQCTSKLRQALNELRVASDADPDEIDAVILMLSRRLATAGQLEEALSIASEGVARARNERPIRPVNLIGSLDALGSAYSKSGNFEKEVEVYEEAFDLARNTLGASHTTTLTMQNNLAVALEHVGKLEDALAHIEQIAPSVIETLGAKHGGALAVRLTLMRLRCRTAKKFPSPAEFSTLEQDSSTHPRLGARWEATRLACSGAQPPPR